jgi:hypothetical protein
VVGYLPATLYISIARYIHTRISEHTCRLLPEPSVSASNPPGPILLLRDFLACRALFVKSVLPLAIMLRSIVMFSLSIMELSADGGCAIDLRDFGRRVAGSVTSSREDIVAVKEPEVRSAPQNAYIDD